MVIEQTASIERQMVTDQDRERRYRQKPLTLLITEDDAIEKAVALEQALFSLGHSAVVVRAEDARNVCPYIEAAGLIAIVAGGQDLPFGLKIQATDLQAAVKSLKQQGILLDL